MKMTYSLALILVTIFTSLSSHAKEYKYYHLCGDNRSSDKITFTVVILAEPSFASVRSPDGTYIRYELEQGGSGQMSSQGGGGYSALVKGGGSFTMASLFGGGRVMMKLNLPGKETYYGGECFTNLDSHNPPPDWMERAYTTWLETEEASMNETAAP